MTALLALSVTVLYWNMFFQFNRVGDSQIVQNRLISVHKMVCEMLIWWQGFFSECMHLDENWGNKS